MEESHDLKGFKIALEGRKIIEVSIGQNGGQLVLKFEDGGMALLKENAFREWNIKHR